MYAVLTRSFDPLHVLLLAGTTVLVALPVVLAEAGVDLAWCLAALALTPWVTVLGYETRGHVHNERVLARLSSDG
jgi:hypothetical protein